MVKRIGHRADEPPAKAGGFFILEPVMMSSKDLEDSGLFSRLIARAQHYLDGARITGNKHRKARALLLLKGAHKRAESISFTQIT
jgi:hypothetical protein